MGTEEAPVSQTRVDTGDSRGHWMLYPSNSNGKAFFYGYKRRPRLIQGSVLICLFRLVLGWSIVLGAAAKHPFMPFFPMVSLRNDQRSVLIPDVPKGSYTSNAESVIVCNSADI